MQSTHATVLNTLQKVQRFMDDNADTLGTINASGARQTLDDIAASLSDHASNQAASKRVGSGETAKQRVLRNALKLNHMRPISAVAASQLKQVPEFLAFKMPETNSTSRRLVAAARGMAAAAEIYAQTFIDVGLAPDFLAQLKGAADTLEASLINRSATGTTQTGATAGLKAESARGREAVKVLDSLIEPQLAGDTVLLVQWKTARRFAGKGTGVTGTSVDAAAKGVPTATTPPVAPAPTPAAAPAPPPAPAAAQTPASNAPPSTTT